MFKIPTDNVSFQYLIAFFIFFTSSNPCLAQKGVLNFTERRNAIKVVNVTIDSLENLPDDLAFENQLQFDSLTFNVTLDFTGVTFNNTVLINHTKFLKEVVFESANYQSQSDFSNSIFRRFNCTGTRFSETSNLSYTFIDSLVFYGALMETIVMVGAQCKVAEFQNAGLSYGNFQNSSFGRVDFSRLTLMAANGAIGAISKPYLNFDNTTFLSTANFSNLNLDSQSELLFTNSSLPDSIDFSFNPRLVSEIDLSVANFNDTSAHSLMIAPQKHSLNLYKSDISKFHFDYIHFKLAFQNPLTKKAISTEDKRSIYEAALKNFKDRGQLESYKLLDVEYQDFKMIESNLSWLRWLPRYWWNFGYNTEYIFIWTALFILFFSFITFFYLDYLSQNVYTMKSVAAYVNKITTQPDNVALNQPDIDSRTPRFRSVNRIWYSFVYTSTLFFKVSLNTEDINFKNIGGSIYVLLVYLTGIVCLGYIANFIFQK